DGETLRTGQSAAGQRSAPFPRGGGKPLTATYAGDSSYNASPASAAETHAVNKADTTATITSDNPDPSDAGQAVTVDYTVTVNVPGAGTPSGNVTVSDGVDSCTGTAAAGPCSITPATPRSPTLTPTPPPHSQPTPTPP